jgi:hypothetical protein
LVEVTVTAQTTAECARQRYLQRVKKKKKGRRTL